MTTIGIIGSGNVGSGLASVLSRAGHTVRITNSDPSGDKLAQVAAQAGATPASAADTIASDVVVLALPYRPALAFVREHAASLAGRVVIDAVNPLTNDFREQETESGTSAAEEFAAAAPGARIVKALNTVFAANYSNERLAEAGVFVPVASDDDEAAEQVVRLVAALGFDAVVVGGLSTARYIEPTVMNLIHLGFFQGHGGNLGLALVRG